MDLFGWVDLAKRDPKIIQPLPLLSNLVVGGYAIPMQTDENCITTYRQLLGPLQVEGSIPWPTFVHS